MHLAPPGYRKFVITFVLASEKKRKKYFNVMEVKVSSSKSQAPTPRPDYTIEITYQYLEMHSMGGMTTGDIVFWKERKGYDMLLKRAPLHFEDMFYVSLPEKTPAEVS